MAFLVRVCKLLIRDRVRAPVVTPPGTPGALKFNDKVNSGWIVSGF